MQFNTEGSEVFLQVVCDGMPYRMIRSVEPAGTIWTFVNSLDRTVVQIPASLGATVDRLFEEGAFSEAMCGLIIATVDHVLDYTWDEGFESGKDAKREELSFAVASVLNPLMSAFQIVREELATEGEQ